MIQLNSSFLAGRWYSLPWRNMNQLMFLWRLSFFISLILHVWWVLFWKNWGNCTTVCDTCYLKRLLICIRMILMYHNENVTSPIQHNKHKHHTDISTQHSWVIICTAQIRPRWYVSRVRMKHHTQRHISGFLSTNSSTNNWQKIIKNWFHKWAYNTFKFEMKR